MRPLLNHAALWLALAASALLASGCGWRAQSPRDRTAEQSVAAEDASSDLSTDAVISRSHGKLELLSPVYTIDKLYPSMTGPWSRVKVRLLETPQPEILWITGCRVEMVDAAAEESMSPQFMCHVNLDLDIEQHKELFSLKSFRDDRLFTLSQGQLEARFPAGFGVPIRSDELVDISTQALNLNWPDETFKVRHHVTVEFVRQCDVATPMRPLCQSGVVGLVSLEGREVAYDANELIGSGKCPSCCAPGKKAVEWAEGVDRFARRFSNHWVVKPGRHEYRTRATSTLNLAADSTIHYIAVHLHPFAQTIELRDLTTGETLFKSHAHPLTEEIGLDHVESFSSAEGLPVYLSHEYELLSTYDNTTDEDQDAMAIMYVYLLDTEYRRPDLPGDPQFEEKQAASAGPAMAGAGAPGPAAPNPGAPVPASANPAAAGPAAPNPAAPNPAAPGPDSSRNVSSAIPAK